MVMVQHTGGGGAVVGSIVEKRHQKERERGKKVLVINQTDVRREGQRRGGEDP